MGCRNALAPPITIRIAAKGAANGFLCIMLRILSGIAVSALECYRSIRRERFVGLIRRYRESQIRRTIKQRGRRDASATKSFRIERLRAWRRRDSVGGGEGEGEGL